VPVATAISFDALLAWELFAGPLAAFVPANAQSLDAWWSTVRASAAYSTRKRNFALKVSPGLTIRKPVPLISALAGAVIGSKAR